MGVDITRFVFTISTIVVAVFIILFHFKLKKYRVYNCNSFKLYIFFTFLSIFYAPIRSTHICFFGMDSNCFGNNLTHFIDFTMSTHIKYFNNISNTISNIRPISVLVNHCLCRTLYNMEKAYMEQFQ